VVDFKSARLSSHINSEALPFKKKESKEDSQFTYWDKAFEKISNTYFRKEAGHSTKKENLLLHATSELNAENILLG